MSLTINLRHLEHKSLVLGGELPVAELDLGVQDALIRPEKPLAYHFEAERLDDALLLRGSLCLPLACCCVRCLKPFERVLHLADWTAHIPLTGEDQAPVVGDSVDLTPYLREDILLEFPQHPLCQTGCRGILKAGTQKKSKSGTSQTGKTPSPWTDLDNLKL